MSGKATRISKIKNLFSSLSPLSLLLNTSYPTSKKIFTSSSSNFCKQKLIHKQKHKRKPKNVWGTAFDGFARQSEFRRPKVMAFRWQRQQQHQHQHQLVPDSPPHNSLLTRSNSNWQQCGSRPLQRPRRDRPSRPVPHCTLSDSLYSCLFSENIGIESQRDIFIHSFFAVSLIGFCKVGVFLWWVFERWRIWTQKNGNTFIF